MKPIYAHPWLSEPSPSLFYQTIPERFTDEDLEGFIVCLEALVASQRAPFAWVVLADAMLSTSAKQRNHGNGITFARPELSFPN